MSSERSACSHVPGLQPEERGDLLGLGDRVGHVRGVRVDVASPPRSRPAATRLRSRISPRSAGRSIVRTRCCMPIAESERWSRTWRKASRTTTAAEGEHHHDQHRHEPAGGRTPQRAAPAPRHRSGPPRPGGRAVTNRCGRRPLRRCSTATTARPTSMLRDFCCSCEVVERLLRARPSGRWCCTTIAFRATIPTTISEITDGREDPEREVEPAARPHAWLGRARRTRARRGVRTERAERDGVFVVAGFGDGVGAGFVRTDAADGRLLDLPRRDAHAATSIRSAARSIALRDAGVPRDLVLGGAQGLLREHRDALVLTEGRT